MKFSRNLWTSANLSSRVLE